MLTEIECCLFAHNDKYNPKGVCFSLYLCLHKSILAFLEVLNKVLLTYDKKYKAEVIAFLFLTH